MNVTEKVYKLEIEGVSSVEDLRKAIEQLNDRLKTLNDTSNEYKETLQEITKYQEKLTDAMNGLGESVNDTNKFVEEFTQGFIDGMKEAVENSEVFQDSVMGEATSVGELRGQIKELQDRLVTLDSSTEAYRNTVELLTAKNQKLQEVMGATKTKVTAAAGSYNALSQELSALRKQWKSTSDEVERAKLGERMGEINAQLKDLDASIGNYQRNVGNYANSMANVFGNPKKEIRELREQLANLVVGSDEYNQVLLKMADLTQQQRHFQDQLKFSSANLEDIFTNMTGVAKGFAGGFSAVNAAMGLFGDQNEDVQKAMLKTQQLMALVQGLSGLEGLKDRIVGLVDGIKTYVSGIGKMNKSTQDLATSEKVLNTETAKSNKLLNIDATLKKLDAKQTTQLAAGNTMAALATKGLSLALKGLKYALISTGLGALLVGLGELIALLGKGLTKVWDWAKGTTKSKEALDQLNYSLSITLNNLDTMLKYYKAIGATSFKTAKKEFKELKVAIDEATEAYEFAKKKFGEKSDEAKEALETLNGLYDRQKGLVSDNIFEIEKMLTEVEKADRQKGMTQLEKDLDETNQKFKDAIDLLEDFKNRVPWAANVVDGYINRLNKDLAKAQEQIIEKNNKNKPKDTNKEKAENLYKETEKYFKKEEQQLKEKYQEEKALLEKYHKDTTLLTKKYYEDLEKLRIEKQKDWQTKYFDHLNTLVNLEKDEGGKLKKNVEVLETQFDEVFGSLEKYGDGAFTVTKDIAEQMKMMGLDPTLEEDIQKMVDKWLLDKKAIEDAKKALKEYASEQKMIATETEGDKISKELQNQLESISLKYEEMASKSFKGFYSGLSPEMIKQEMEERYAAMEVGINKEIELWKKAAEDETLTEKDRAEAIENYNDALRKKQVMVAEKTIEANNLMIQSYQMVTNAISSMAQNLTSILGTVSDMIMSNAEAQLEAGKISEEEYKKQFETAKAFQIAQATINTIAGAVAAFMGITSDTGGWGIAAAAIEAAAVLAAGFAQIAQIKATQPSTSGGGSNGANGFTLPNVMISEPEYQQNITNQSDIDALANALGDKLNGQMVYILESDIQNANNKYNKRRTEVTF